MDCFSESTQIILNVVLLSQSSVQFAYQYMDLNGIVNETLSAKWHGLGREVWPDTDIFLRCLQIIQKLYTIASSQCSCPINTTESVWDRDKVRCKGQFDADTANPPDAANIEYKRKSETNFEALRVQTRSNPSPHNLENSSSETSDTERIHRSVQKKRVYQIPMDQAQEDIDAVIIFGQSHYQHSNSLSMLRGLQKGTVDIRSKTETVDKMKCNIYFECYRLTTSSLSKLKIINGLKQISNERVLVSGHPNVRSEIENVAKEANSAAEVAEQINDKITSGQSSPDEYGSQKHKNRADASEEPRSHEDIHSEFRYEGVDLQQYEDKKVGLRQSRNKLHDVPLKNETNVEEQLNGEDTHCGQPIEELDDVPLQNETNIEEQLTEEDTHCVQPIEELHDVPLQNETNVEEQLTDKDTHCGQSIEELDDVPLQNETNIEEQLTEEDTHCGQPIEELDDVPLQNETNVEEQLTDKDTHCGQPIEELDDVPLQNETNVEEQLNGEDTHCGQSIEELDDVPLQNETNIEEQLTEEEAHCDIRQLGAGSNHGLQETSTGTRGSRERPRNINAAEVKPVMVEAASVAISSSNKHTTDIDKLQPTTKSLMNTIIGKRHLVTYHVSRHRGLPLNWMKYEVLRLCSFGRFRNFENLGQWPTRLAQIGFYFVESDGTAITRCYSCAKEYQNLLNMSLEHAHEPACNWEDTNISIKDSLRGFSNEELEKYMIEYGSGLSRKPEEGHAGSTVGLAELSEYGDGVEDDCGSDPIRQPSAAGLMDGSSTDGMFGRGRRSLPENLNELSGSVVAEESPQTVATSQAFLTSASEKPMSLPDEEVDNVDIEGASSEGAEARLPRFDLRQASYPQFASSYSRSQTYGSWSRDHPKRPEHLSDAGFFFAGYADCVRCFYCGLGLKYWRVEDIPEYQHARFRPECVFNRMYMGQEYVDRVQLDRGGGPTASNYLARQQSSQPRAANPQGSQTSLAPTSRAPETETTQVNATVPSGEALSPFLNGSLAASAMSRGWTREQVNQALLYITRELGEANLSSDALEQYLNGTEQRRRHPSGDSGMGMSASTAPVSDSSGTQGTSSGTVTDPSSEFSTEANDAQSSGGSEIGAASSIADANTDLTTNKPDVMSGPSEADEGATAQAPVEFEPTSSEDSVHVKQQMAELEYSLLHQRVLCHVCQSEPVACVYMPCGHVIACKPCADSATHCIICGRGIGATANIYLS